MEINHRKPLRNYFITYPKSNPNMMKQSFAEILMELNCKIIKVVEETHRDGTPHMHAIIILKNKKNKKNILEFLKKEFPNSYKRIHVGSIRNVFDANRYIQKEDKDPYVYRCIETIPDLFLGPIHRQMYYKQLYKDISLI